MTDKDLKLMYLQERGEYPVGLDAYIEWLEGKVIQFENENYKLKRELNLNKNNNYNELREGFGNR